MIRNQKGFSLVELLVVMSLVGIVASMSAGYIISQRQRALFSHMNSLRIDYEATARSSLSLGSICKSILPTTGSFSAGGGTINLMAGVGGPEKMNQIIFSDLFEVKAARLTYRPFFAEAAAGGFVDKTYLNSGTDRELVGRITLEYGLKADAMVGVGGLDSMRDKVVFDVPVKLMNEGANIIPARQWRFVMCAAEDSEEATFKSQVCNIYGGALTDGSYCDFPRVLRNSPQYKAYGDPANVPTQKMTQNATNKVNRVRLGDILCYIDSLIVLTETIASVNPTAAKQVTTNCRHPGGNSLSRISKDAQVFFQ